MVPMACAARGFVFGLKSTLQIAGSSARVTFFQRSRTYFVKRGPIIAHIPKVSLMCVGLVSASAHPTKYQIDKIPRPQVINRPSLAKIKAHKVIFYLRLSFRAIILLLKFVPLLILYPLTFVSARLACYWLDALLWVTETSGPTFIKLGQWASTRRDIFSPQFCERFSRLHVKVRPHPWFHTQQCLQRAFGEDWRKVFIFENDEPVGSGCVAQVYRAWARVDRVVDPAFQALIAKMNKEDLYEAWEISGFKGVTRVLKKLWKGGPKQEGSKDRSRFDGQHEDKTARERLIPVAIKVLHPGIRGKVEIDLILMKAGSWLLQCLPRLKWLSVCEVVTEFEKLMTKQIDLRFEAENIVKFRENFGNIDYVKFPTPLYPFVTRTVLVETFEEGEPISSFLSPDIPLETQQKIAQMGVDTLLKMVFVDNFVHGDLHPGNILVQCRAAEEHHAKIVITDLFDTGVVSVKPEPCPLQLVLLDAGIVAQLSERDLENFKAVFKAVVQRQGEEVAELILHHARDKDCSDVLKFKKEMAELVDHALQSNTLSLGKIQVADLLSRVFGLLIKHKVKLESNFASIVFAIMVLEGLGRSLDPNLDILDTARPLLLKNCASLL